MELVLIIEMSDIGSLQPKLNQHPDARDDCEQGGIGRHKVVDKHYRYNSCVLSFQTMGGLVMAFIGFLLAIGLCCLKMVVVAENLQSSGTQVALNLDC